MATSDTEGYISQAVPTVELMMGNMYKGFA